MNEKYFSCLLFSLFGLLISSFAIKAQALSNNQKLFYQTEILKYINGYRNAKKLQPLTIDDNLSTIAYNHSQNMSGHKTSFGHDGFYERMKMAKSFNPKLTSFAENVAYGLQTPAEVSRDWYGSSGHKKNILGNFSRTGIGVERGEDGYLYFTQVFQK